MPSLTTHGEFEIELEYTVTPGNRPGRDSEGQPIEPEYADVVELVGATLRVGEAVIPLTRKHVGRKRVVRWEREIREKLETEKL